jgi:thiamine pyrophosphate-dependent acetolactate synthase large subunit-like protein
MRRLLLLICILGVSSAARTRSQAGDWENLNALRAGETIQVRELNKTKITGTFLNVTEAAIALQADAGAQSIQRQDVRSVKRMKNRHRLRNALILGGVGAGVGAGIGAAAHHPCPASQSLCFDIGGRSLPAGIGAVAGFLGGGTVGALLPDHETIYSVRLP